MGAIYSKQDYKLFCCHHTADQSLEPKLLTNKNVWKAVGLFLVVGIPTYFLAAAISSHLGFKSLFPISLACLAGAGCFLGGILLQKFAGLQRNEMLSAWAIYVLINLAPGLFIHMQFTVLFASFFQAFILPMSVYLTMRSWFEQKSIKPVESPMPEFSVKRQQERGFRATSLTAWLGLIFIIGLGAGMVLFPFGYAANIDGGSIWFAGPCIFFGVVLILFGLWLFCRVIMIVLGFITKDTPPGPVGRLVMQLLATVAPRK